MSLKVRSAGRRNVGQTPHHWCGSDRSNARFGEVPALEEQCATAPLHHAEGEAVAHVEPRGMPLAFPEPGEGGQRRGAVGRVDGDDLDTKNGEGLEDDGLSVRDRQRPNPSYCKRDLIYGDRRR